MASGLYKKGIEGVLNGSIDMDTDTLRAVLIDTGTYTVNLTTHEDYADLTGIVGTESDVFTSVVVPLGVLDAADSTFTSISGATIEALVIFKDTGVAANDILIAYIDGFTTVTPDGGNITATWDSGANKIINYDS